MWGAEGVPHDALVRRLSGLHETQPHNGTQRALCFWLALARRNLAQRRNAANCELTFCTFLTGGAARGNKRRSLRASLAQY